MKRIMHIVVFAAVTFFLGCKKQDNKIYFEGGTNPQLISSASKVILEPGLEDKQAITFQWTNPEYRFTSGISSQDVNYKLEIDTVGGNFKSSNKFVTIISKDLSVGFTVAELNSILGNVMSLQLEPRRKFDMEARVISNLRENSVTLASNSIIFSATPFTPPPLVKLPVNGEIWLVGGASLGGWNNPLPEPYIKNQKFTKLSDTKYELITTLGANDGYLVLPVMGSWDTKYCLNVPKEDRPKTVNGFDFVFKTGGGEDFLSPTPGGTFKITFDFQKGKFTVVRQ